MAFKGAGGTGTGSNFGGVEGAGRGGGASVGGAVGLLAHAASSSNE